MPEVFTLTNDLRATPCPFRPTLLRWARAIDNGAARRIAEEIRSYATGDWPGLDEWRDRLEDWADQAEGIAVFEEWNQLEPRVRAGIAGAEVRWGAR